MDQLTVQITAWGYTIFLASWQLAIAIGIVFVLFQFSIAAHRKIKRAIHQRMRVKLWRSESEAATASLRTKAARIFSTKANEPIVLESIQVRNFKGITSLDLDFTPESTLNGNWTCIAGINGAGKSS